MIETPKKIILLSDIIDQRLRKERELEYYQKQLEEISIKISYLSRELDLTNLIIDMIESEKVIDIQDYMVEKKNDRS
jgi:hypothetical protein